MADKTIIYDTGTDVLTLDATNMAWASATVTARYAVIYDEQVSEETSPLIGYQDFGEDVTSTAGTFTITWAEGGLFTIAMNA